MIGIINDESRIALYDVRVNKSVLKMERSEYPFYTVDFNQINDKELLISWPKAMYKLDLRTMRASIAVEELRG